MRIELTARYLYLSRGCKKEEKKNQRSTNSAACSEAVIKEIQDVTPREARFQWPFCMQNNQFKPSAAPSVVLQLHFHSLWLWASVISCNELHKLNISKKKIKNKSMYPVQMYYFLISLRQKQLIFEGNRQKRKQTPSICYFINFNQAPSLFSSKQSDLIFWSPPTWHHFVQACFVPLVGTTSSITKTQPSSEQQAIIKTECKSKYRSLRRFSPVELLDMLEQCILAFVQTMAMKPDFFLKVPRT